MRIIVEHETRYRYAEEASYSIQLLMLTPTEFDGQRVVQWTLESEPAGAICRSQDGFGNKVQLLTIRAPHREIVIRAAGIVDREDRHGLVQGAPETVPVRVYLRRTPLTDLGKDQTATFLGMVPDAGMDTLDFLHELMQTVRKRIEYTPGATNAATTAAEALAVGHGVCQDHSQTFIAVARAAGIPARYVTGYMLLDAEHPVEAHHAWAEAWVDGLGWIGFDVANGICPTDSYVRMTWGLDARHAAPIRGTRRGVGQENLDVVVVVSQDMAQQ